MKRYKYIAALLIGSLIGFSGCTDNFESDNEIKGAFNDEVKEYDYQKYTMPLEIIQSGIYFQYNWGDGINWPWQTLRLFSTICSPVISMIRFRSSMTKILYIKSIPDGRMQPGIILINTYLP